MKRILAAFTALLILCSGFYANAEKGAIQCSKSEKTFRTLFPKRFTEKTLTEQFLLKKDNGSALFFNLECRMHKRDGIHADGGGRFPR